MSVYKPIYVEDELDLRCALKSNAAVIVTRNRELFDKLEEKVERSKGKRLLGNIGIGAGAAVCLVFHAVGIGASIIAGNVLAKYLRDGLRDYNFVIDYAEKQVILLRKHNPHKFNENIDTIDGIDLNAIAIQNS